jgi:thymidylate synthase (FAD)
MYTPITVELLRVDGTDLDVVNAARCSYDAQSHDFSDRDAKLIRYLATHGHWSPLAHVGAQFRISAPIFVARQLVKHQVGLVLNEVSRRYVDSEPTFFKPSSWRGRPANSKQGSSGDVANQHLYHELHDDLIENALAVYQRMIDDGVAPEQARMVLPLSAMTTWIWTGSLVAWSRVCHLRMAKDSQAETQVVARKIDSFLADAFPVSWKALMGDNND